MRAAIYTSRGPAAEVLRIIDKPEPPVSAGEVRVKLAFSGVNPSDVKSRSGVAARASGFAEVTPHSDGAGVIDAVGEGVDTSRIGQRVWTYNGQWERPYGTAAEFITLPAAQCVPLPDVVPLEVGASIGIPLMTAMHAVQACGSLLGKTVLVPGAAGSVGFYVTQLASRAGAHVIAIVSNEDKASRARQIGASEVINYKTESLVERVQALTHHQGADVIIDLDAASNAPLYGHLLGFQGKAIVYGSNQPQFSMPFGPMILGFVSVYCFIVYKLPPAEMRAVIGSVQAILADPTLVHPPTAIYPLDNIAAAHQQVERGANAKVLVRL
ncbi:MAG: NADPH:quinone reductase [Oxalobacteraceae bacterium]